TIRVWEKSTMLAFGRQIEWSISMIEWNNGRS
ncbi:MAG: hypothetical protein ACI8RD_008780, partial [Bacillariaceae sp.]